MNKSTTDEGKVTVMDKQRGKYQRGGCITVSITHLLNPFLFLSIAHTSHPPSWRGPVYNSTWKAL